MKNILFSIVIIFLIVIQLTAQKLVPISTYINKQKATPYDLAVNDQYAFLALGEEGLLILDISSLQDIKKLTTYTESEIRSRKKIFGTANGVDTEGNYVYLAYGNLGLKVIDISTPEYPKTVGTYYKHQWVYSVDVYDNFAFLGLQSEGMHIVDISDPSDLKLVSKKNVKDLFVKDICLAKGLYVISVADIRGLKIFNYKLPLSSFQPSGFPKDFKTNGSAEEIEVVERYAFLANGNGGFGILDLVLPTYPQWVNTIKTRDNATGIAVNNEYAFIANGNSITTIDIYDPTNSFEVCSYEKIGYKFTKVRIKDNYIFAAFYTKKKYFGLMVFKIS